MTRSLGLLSSVAAVAVALAGCAAVPRTAVVDGQTVARLDLDFTGSPYIVHHRGAHPRPRGPSSGLKDVGGSITGQVCGMDLDYDVQHDGDHVQLVGSLDGVIGSQLQVRDAGGERVINGSLGRLTVNLHLRSNELVGQVGMRVFRLHQEEDSLSGEMRLVDTTSPSKATLKGRDALWAMPAAAQAAVLSNLLTCFVQRIGSLGGTSDLEVAVGGAGGALPAQSSALYRDAPSRL